MAHQRILVTGAAGTLGQDLVSRLALFPQFETMGTTSSQLNLAWDASKIAEVLDEFQPEIIVNTAAFTAVDAAEKDYETPLVVNGRGPQLLAEWADRHQAYLVHISTDYVFDGNKGTLYEPGDATHPINRYGSSKLAGEKAVLAVLPTHGVVLRTSWLFGAGSKNFVPFVIQAARSQSPVRIAEDQWGTPTWTGNICKMVLEVIETRPTGVLHACSTGRTTRYEQALFLCQAMGVSAEFMTPVPTEAFDFPAARPHDTAMKSSFDSALEWREATEKFLQTQGFISSHV